jgi:tRNA(fMet)-specific endonuclease VapC
MRGDRAVVARMAALEKTDVAVPQPVLAEIYYGIARLRPSRKKTWLTQRLAVFARELPRVVWSDEVSEQFGRLKADLKNARALIEDFDVAIAAHAVAHAATLVTSNRAHMQRVKGLEVEDWAG